VLKKLKVKSQSHSLRFKSDLVVVFWQAVVKMVPR